MTTFLSEFSTEIHWEIASYLDFSDQCRLKLVCRQAYSIYGKDCGTFQKTPEGILKLKIYALTYDNGKLYRGYLCR